MKFNEINYEEVTEFCELFKEKIQISFEKANINIAQINSIKLAIYAEPTYGFTEVKDKKINITYNIACPYPAHVILHEIGHALHDIYYINHYEKLQEIPNINETVMHFINEYLAELFVTNYIKNTTSTVELFDFKLEEEPLYFIVHNLVTDKKDKTFLDKINLTAKQILGIEEKAEKLYEIIETNGPVSLFNKTYLELYTLLLNIPFILELPYTLKL